MLKLRKAFAILLVTSVFAIDNARYSVPEPQIEALKSGEFRVAIPDINGMKFIAFHANINESIKHQEPGLILGEATSKTNGFWVLTFEQSLKIGDILSYWIFVTHNRIGYYKLGEWKIDEVRDSFTPLINVECTNGYTTIDGGKSTCIGTAIIEDNFDGSQINQNRWIVQHKIPTYTSANSEFNTYKNRNDVRFIKNGVLFLKPKALLQESEVRGILNLTDGCTSNNRFECYYRQQSSFLLPPVVCSKIGSKTSFKYGIVEIRAKLPAGDWIYPILELEPTDKSDGENAAKIWIAYSRGNDYLRSSQSDDIGSRLLFGGPVLNPAEPGRSKALASIRSQNPYSNDFHVYSMEWRPGKITLYIDSVLFGDISTAKSFADPHLGIGSNWYGPESPFNREYTLSLGVAVGGVNDFPDGYNSENDPKPWLNGDRNYVKTFFDARHVWTRTWKGDNPALQIDYVKVTAI